MATKLGMTVLAALLLFPVLIAAAAQGALSAVFGTTTSGSTTIDCAAGGAVGASSTAAVAGYRPEQIVNAATIIAVGKQLGVPPQGWVVALAAAMQESGLENLDHGDRDSLGLFQQRPSQGWGTPAQIRNPTYAATQFYRHLLAIPGWQRLSVTDAAQTVQRSATPTAYAAHEHAAREIVAAVGSATC